MRNIFTLDSCASIVGSEVRAFSVNDEAKMLAVSLKMSDFRKMVVRGVKMKQGGIMNR